MNRVFREKSGKSKKEIDEQDREQEKQEKKKQELVDKLRFKSKREVDNGKI